MAEFAQKDTSLFTIGHSTHGIDLFLELVTRQNIRVVLDVRSAPYSVRAPQFNRPALRKTLEAVGLKYLFAGDRLGGRPSDLTLYSEGRANYVRMAGSIPFIEGLRKAVVVSKAGRLVFLCSEADPLECHRFLLLGRHLSTHGVPVAHILPTGLVETHSEAENRMVRNLGLYQTEIFPAVQEPLKAAYQIHEEKFAYRLPGLDASRKVAL